MVIHQFNKLIRNRWLWGAFAIAISAFFAFDFLIADLGSESRAEMSGDAGTLAGKSVDGKLFAALAEEARGFGRSRDWQMKQGDVNRQAWENYAALLVAGKAGVEATDAEVQAIIRRDPSFQQNGGFSFALYQRALRDNGLTPERFEAFLKRRVTLMRLGQAVLGSAAWTSPMELDQAVADMTDTFTVKVATFTQSKKDADAEAANAEQALSAAQQARQEAQRKAQEEAARQAEEAAKAAEAEAAKAEAAKEADKQEQADSASAPAAAEAAGDSSAGTVEAPSDDGADWASERDVFVAQWAGRIDAYLAGSPMAGTGKVFAEAAWDYGVDPRWSPAISNTESSKGLYCSGSCNAWGWGSCSWGSWEDAIRDHVAGLARGYGYTISVDAAKRYCPPNWEHWYNATLAQMNMI